MPRSVMTVSWVRLKADLTMDTKHIVHAPMSIVMEFIHLRVCIQNYSLEYPMDHLPLRVFFLFYFSLSIVHGWHSLDFTCMITSASKISEEAVFFLN